MQHDDVRVHVGHRPKDGSMLNEYVSILKYHYQRAVHLYAVAEITNKNNIKHRYFHGTFLKHD